MTAVRTVYDPVTKIWQGPPAPKPWFDPSKSVGQLIIESLQSNPDRITQINIDDGHSITNSEMLLLTVRASQNLINMGLQTDEILTVIVRNTSFVTPVVLAAIVNGSPVNAIDTMFDIADTIHLLQIVRPKMILCDPDVLKQVQDAVQKTELTCTIIVNSMIHCEGVLGIDDLIAETGREDQFKISNSCKSSKDSLLFVLCSSGTTGKSKGICISKETYLFNLSVSAVLPAEIKLLLFSSLYWFSGMFTLVTGTIIQACRFITSQTFTPRLLFEINDKYKPHFCFLGTNQLGLVIGDPDAAKADLNNLLMYCAGCALPHASFEKTRKLWPKMPLITCYGLTEIACTCAATSAGYKPGSSGYLSAGVKARIRKEDGMLAGPNEEGEIILSNDINVMGYYENSMATEHLLDANGWIKTGDIAYFDDDGYLFVVDRKSEIIKYAGVKIAPVELEEVILRHDDVVEVAATGFFNLEYGALPSALVVLKKDSKSRAIDIMAFTQERIPNYKQLKGGIYIVDSIPKTPSYKINRRKVREIANDKYNESLKH